MRAFTILALITLLSCTVLAEEKISRGDRAKMRETRETMASLQQDLSALRGPEGYPKDLKAVVDGNLRDSLPKDGWGREFAYEVSIEHGFKLTSWGSDGKAGGDGAARDIVWTSKGELREMSADEKAAYEAKLDELRFQATRVVARKRMIQVGSEIITYRRSHDSWPENLEDCKRESEEPADLAINRCFDDPFGHAFALRLLPHDNFAVVCWGADGEEGGLERASDFVVTERDVRAEYNKVSNDFWGWGGRYDDTDWRVQNLADDVLRYKQQAGKLPEELIDLTRVAVPADGKENGTAQPIRTSLPKDRWGNDYVYVRTSEDVFFIVGLGKDGIEGGIKDNKDAIFPKPGTDPAANEFDEGWDGAVMVKPEQDDNDILVEVANEWMLDIIDKLKAYKAEHGEYPASLDDIKDQMVDKKIPNDPWDKAFVYTLTKDESGKTTGFTLTCYGSDGAQGGEGHAADITLNQDSEAQPAPEDENPADNPPEPEREFK
ncbi:MAG: type II secretion system protein GspG [Planctomycetes bacterium]|nr:type II secretion system protein GspG [Planctomycetota bacterium]